jgi:hypothetical protein
MSLSEDAIPGAALASILVHQAIITTLVSKGVFNRDEMLELLDGVLQSAEKMQANFAALSNAAGESSARGARFQIASLYATLQKLGPSPSSSEPLS